MAAFEMSSECLCYKRQFLVKDDPRSLTEVEKTVGPSDRLSW